MIDLRGEGPGVLLPMLARRAELTRQLVDATINKRRPAETLATLFIPSHGAGVAGESNHWLTSTRYYVANIIVSPGGSGANARYQLRVGTATLFAFAWRNIGETEPWPLPFVVDAGVEVFLRQSQAQSMADMFAKLVGFAER